MGQQIGFQCALHGYEVILYDIDPKAFDTALALERIGKLFQRVVSEGKIDQNKADQVIKKIRASTDPQEASDVDFVSESVPENPELKGKVFAQFNKICPAHAIFTTNTSTLAPSMFAEATGRPDRFAALHFHDVP
jgi:3-hydroxybutyryl-CoA dehydrogenase